MTETMATTLSPTIYNPINKEITEAEVVSLLKEYKLPPIIFNMTLFKRAFVHTSYLHSQHKSNSDSDSESDGSGNVIENDSTTKNTVFDGVVPLKHKSNERLEYLGDGILEAITKFYLYKRFPMKDEGFMTEAKISLVKNESLGKLVQKIGLHKWFIISKEAEEKGLRTNIKKLGCLFEAFVGALFLNFNKIVVDDEDILKYHKKNSGNSGKVMSGFNVCTQFIENVFETFVDWNELLGETTNYKNVFQVMIQKEFQVTPNYVLLNNDMHDNKPQSTYHSGVFVCCGNVTIHNTPIAKAIPYKSLSKGFETMHTLQQTQGGFMVRFADASHTTKKKAEQEACRLSIAMLK